MSRLSLVLALLAVFALGLGAPRPALAQAAANSGALTINGVFDVPSVYVFRGLVQERDPSLTLLPSLDVGIAIASGDGLFKRVAVDAGWWNSYHTGSSGTGGPSDLSHYEEDVYAMLNLGFGGGLGVSAGYRARTSPNRMFGTINEAQVRLDSTSRFRPYGFLAFELGDESSDGGANQGSYAEFGIGPSFPLGGKLTLAIPVKVGLSLKDYYEYQGEDSTFGFFDVGGLVTLPLGAGGKYGRWNVHGGADFYALGDTAKEFNQGEGSKFVVLAGVGVTY